MTDTTDIKALRSEAANIIGLLTSEGRQSFTLDKTADFFDDVFRLLEAERQRADDLQSTAGRLAQESNRLFDDRQRIPAQVTEALTAALVDGADAETALKLALAGYHLVDTRTPYNPALGFVDCLEEAVNRTQGLDFETAAKMLAGSFVITPRIRFERTEENRIGIFRGDESVGEIYHWKAGDVYFLDIPGHPHGDRPGIQGEMRAKAYAQDILDQPA